MFKKIFGKSKSADAEEKKVENLPSSNSSNPAPSLEKPKKKKSGLSFSVFSKKGNKEVKNFAPVPVGPLSGDNDEKNDRDPSPDSQRSGHIRFNVPPSGNEAVVDLFKAGEAIVEAVDNPSPVHIVEAVNDVEWVVNDIVNVVENVIEPPAPVVMEEAKDKVPVPAANPGIVNDVINVVQMLEQPNHNLVPIADPVENNVPPVIYSSYEQSPPPLSSSPSVSPPSSRSPYPPHRDPAVLRKHGI